MNQSMKYAVRFSTYATVCVTGWLFLAGCSDHTGNGLVSSRSSTSGGTTAAVSAQSTLPKAKLEAEGFLKALCGGDVKAASVKVAVDFKKEFFPPFYDDEKTHGYSESDAQKKLQAMTKGLSNPTFRSQVLAPDGKQASFRGQLTGEKAAMFSLRLIKQGNDWMVSRFAVVKVLTYAVPKDDGNAELTWIRETALDFLEDMIGDDDEQTMTMSDMTPDFKKRLPSPSVADAGLGYAKKDVRQWLSDQRKEVTGFMISMQELDPKGRKFTGELTGAGMPKPVTLRVLQSDGKWLVDDFVVKN
ncbi:MAG TPA: hypothetical protein VGZ47_13800 [Gemmataceae bacterium]|nr:hypothetical protein [Gemmataceae bacterium]